MTLYMPLFRVCTTSTALAQLHAHLIITGLCRDPLASTKLIESYAQMDHLQSSKLIFDTFPKADSFMWGVIVKCFMWRGFFQESISLFHDMVQKHAQIGSFIFPSVLRACSRICDLYVGEKVHGRIIKCGFDRDPVVQTSLLGLYGENAHLVDARKIFDEMLVQDVVSWSSIISGYVQNGQESEGLEIFSQMLSKGVEIDSVTMLSVVEACAELALWKEAKATHGFIMRRHIVGVESLYNSLIAMYGKCDDLRSAKVLFNNVIHQNTTSWTAMITSYNQSGYHQQALEAFIEMQESNVEPNAVTNLCVLCSCARIGCLREGKSIHGFIIKRDLDPKYDLLGPTLIDLYANCRQLKYCQKVFHSTQPKEVVSWNILISSYAQEGLSDDAFFLFVQMRRHGPLPDSFTLASVLSTCGSISFAQLGCQIHGYVIKTGFENEFITNSLIDMYSKSGYVDSAYTIFKNTLQRSVTIWNSMLCGFSQNCNSMEAISLFNQICANCLEVDKVTFLGALQACSNLGYLEKGKWIHHRLIIYGFQNDIYIDTALTDMYAKCGDLKTARRVFDSMLEKNVVSWTVMIGVYGIHGHIDAAISLFNTMLKSGIRPNDVTFMNILSACSHSGYVEEGKLYFKSMERDFNIQPKYEHFACLVDLLSRAGDINTACKIINSMPFPVDAGIWGALLNGCRIHGRMDMVKTIEQHVPKMHINDTGYYTVLSNIYAEGGEWNVFRNVRSMMKGAGLKKVPGYSMVKMNSSLYKFGANNASRLQVEVHNI